MLELRGALPGADLALLLTTRQLSLDNDGTSRLGLRTWTLVKKASVPDVLSAETGGSLTIQGYYDLKSTIEVTNFFIMTVCYCN
uniref:Uncharacterized protein n=1 Tax=Romanomermis culicivorax TaxID=13658 RepID=A0A915IDZ4_ROMCU